MKLIRLVDDFIIDQVCQPLVDRLDRVCSCYQLAAGVFVTASALGVAQASTRGAWFSVVIWLLLPTGLVRRAYLLDARPPSDVRPVERVSELSFRSIMLTMRLWFLVPTAMVATWTMIIDETAWWLVSLGLYLLACRRRPPRREVATLPWWRALGVST